MRSDHTRLLAAGTALLVALSGCASSADTDDPPAAAPETSAAAAPVPEATEGGDTDVVDAADGDAEEPAGADTDTSIPAGAYAAQGEFPFPIPEGWTELDPFTEDTLGKDASMYGSVEYPGDAKDAAAVYLDVLRAAGFDAYAYAPGEMTNQASLAAEGRINGTPYIAILDFDVHADGYQRVSINAVERD